MRKTNCHRENPLTKAILLILWRVCARVWREILVVLINHQVNKCPYECMFFFRGWCCLVLHSVCWLNNHAIRKCFSIFESFAYQRQKFIKNSYRFGWLRVNKPNEKERKGTSKRKKFSIVRQLMGQGITDEHCNAIDFLLFAVVEASAREER